MMINELKIKEIRQFQAAKAATMTPSFNRNNLSKKLLGFGHDKFLPRKSD